MLTVTPPHLPRPVPPGMDPGARRAMWDAILRATKPHQQQGAQQQPQPPVSLVLTTHYMDEAEALCERVGIMKAGRLVCLGAPQELKSTYGTEYELELQMDERRTAEAAEGAAEANGHWHVGAGGSGAVVTAAWAAGLGEEEGVAGAGGPLLSPSLSLSRGSASLGSATSGIGSSSGLWGAASLTPAQSAVAAAVAAAGAGGGPACVSVEEVVCRLAAVFPGARLLQRDEERRHARVALPARGLALGRVFQVRWWRAGGQQGERAGVVQGACWVARRRLSRMHRRIGHEESLLKAACWSSSFACVPHPTTALVKLPMPHLCPVPYALTMIPCFRPLPAVPGAAQVLPGSAVVRREPALPGAGVPGGGGRPHSGGRGGGGGGGRGRGQRGCGRGGRVGGRRAAAMGRAVNGEVWIRRGVAGRATVCWCVQPGATELVHVVRAGPRW